jgi:hypothetical protein
VGISRSDFYCRFQFNEESKAASLSIKCSQFDTATSSLHCCVHEAKYEVLESELPLVPQGNDDLRNIGIQSNLCFMISMHLLGSPVTEGIESCERRVSFPPPDPVR